LFVYYYFMPWIAFAAGAWIAVRFVLSYINIIILYCIGVKPYCGGNYLLLLCSV